MKLLVAVIIIVGVVVLFNAAYGLTTFQGIQAKPAQALNVPLGSIVQAGAAAASAAAKATAPLGSTVRGAPAPAYIPPIVGPQ